MDETFIALLSGEDAPTGMRGANVSDENTGVSDHPGLAERGYLAFMSQRSLTGYDNEDVSSAHPGNGSTRRSSCSTRDGRLTCASCDPSGARPTGVLDQEHSGEGVGLVVDRRESWRGQWLAGNIPGGTSESLTAR